ncbi:MAG: DUF2065 domain-containing protein [bacterium]|nr:DUF2065 domain-containing protein [bacterium]
MNLILIVLGLVLVIEGLPYFLFPGRVKRFYDQIRELEEGVLRTVGFVMIVIGLIIVYFLNRVVSF